MNRFKTHFIRLRSILSGFLMLGTFQAIAAEETRITVTDEALSRAPFLGFGVQWSAYPWCDLTDAEWQRVFDRLDYMRVPLVRCMLRAYWYCEGYDKAGKPIYNWESARMKKLYRLLDYCESRKITVMIGEWDDPACDEDRQDPAADKLQPYEIQETDRRWPVLICDFLEHLFDKRGYTCLHYYNLINEPNGDWSGCADFDSWKTAIINLRLELKKRKLHERIAVIGPDTTWQKDHYWIELSVRQLNRELGAYEVHEYAPIPDVESGWIEQFFRVKNEYVRRYDPQGATKPFFMGEVGMQNMGPLEPRGGRDSQLSIYDPIYAVWMADYLVQVGRAGMDGAVAWMLDDAMHVMKDEKSDWPKLDKVLWKKWGFWNSLGEQLGFPEDAKLRPWFYTWSLMSREFPAGSRTVRSTYPSVPGLRSLSARTPGGGTSHVVVNDGDAPLAVRLIDPHAKAKLKWSRYHFFPQDKPTGPDGYPLAKEAGVAIDLAAGLPLNLPPRSVLILASERSQ